MGDAGTRLPGGGVGRWPGLCRQIAYASPEIAAEAASVVLSGSVAGLAPDQALGAAMATTRLRATILDGQIAIVAAPEDNAGPA